MAIKLTAFQLNGSSCGIVHNDGPAPLRYELKRGSRMVGEIPIGRCGGPNPWVFINNGEYRVIANNGTPTPPASNIVTIDHLEEGDDDSCVEFYDPTPEPVPPPTWWDRHNVAVILVAVCLVLIAITCLYMWREAKRTEGEQHTTSWIADPTGTVSQPNVGDPVPESTAPAAVLIEPAPSTSPEPATMPYAASAAATSPSVADITESAGALTYNEVVDRIHRGVGTLDGNPKIREIIQTRHGVSLTLTSIEGKEAYAFIEAGQVYLFDPQSLTFRLITRR